MDSINKIFSLVSILFFIHSLMLVSFFKCNFSSANQLVPAMFVFGDSEVDVGNNNYLPLSLLKANFPHNGIDFPTMKPTGRFSNGKNPVDFIAEKVGLPSPPPYLSLASKENDMSFMTGVNFASGGSGVFNSTGQSYGGAIPLIQQIDYFSSVHQKLEQKLGARRSRQHLSKSIFLIATGSNDLFTYSRSNDLRNKVTPQHYLNSMILILRQQIQRLNKYGASKFVIGGLAKIGCTPSQRINREGEECNEEINSWCLQINEGLKSILMQLAKPKIATPIHYSLFDTYAVIQNILYKPASYGYTEVKAACCGLGKLNAEVPCIPVSTFCSNRTNHVFWDAVHPTETTYRLLADSLFDGSSNYTFPVNARQLIAI